VAEVAEVVEASTSVDSDVARVTEHQEEVRSVIREILIDGIVQKPLRG
jgi:hypothetical protein